MSYVDWYRGDRDQHLTTPRDFFEVLHAEYRFTLDGAASADNQLLRKASTIERPKSWKGQRVFCNPPWSDIPPFIELAARAEFACLLVPARTNCRWFHRALELGAVVRFFKPKLHFGGLKDNSPVDNVLLLFGSAQSATDEGTGPDATP